MKYIKYTIILIIIIFSSCSNDESFNDGEFIRFNLDDNMSSLDDFISLIDTTKIISLKGAIISEINQIIAKDSSYYILDKNLKKIFKFDSNGKCLFVIDRKGRAKGEYLSISNISVTTKFIRIFDGANSKLIDICKITGEFITEHRLKGVFSNVISNDLITAGYNSTGDSYFSKEMVFVYDSLMNRKNSAINIPSSLSDISIRQYVPMITYANEILLTRLLSNKIYSISKDSVSVKYTLDFGDYTLTDKYIGKFSDKKAGHLLNQLLKSDYVNSIDFFMETDHYINFIFLYKAKVHIAYYNKKSGECNIFNTSSIDDINSHWLLHGNVATNERSDFIATIYPLSFSEDVIRKLKVQNLSITNNLIQHVINAKDEDNPLLLLYTLKSK